MKLLIAIFLISFSVTAQEIRLGDQIQAVPVVIDHSTIDVKTNAFPALIKANSKTIVRKKSYKNIIENTLSGRKNLIFKVRHEIKLC